MVLCMGGVALVRYTQFNCASIANRSVRWMVLVQLTMCVHAAVLAWVVWAACMGCGEQQSDGWYTP